jgi:hypothetical protein
MSDPEQSAVVGRLDMTRLARTAASTITSIHPLQPSCARESRRLDRA